MEAPALTAPEPEVHRISWWGVAAGGHRVPRNRHMKGSDWGWDATCSCGWDSRTGGALVARIKEAVEDHKQDVEMEQHPERFGFTEREIEILARARQLRRTRS